MPTTLRFRTYGLFADDDGGNPVWDFLASLTLIPGDSITAAASDDGLTVLAGTQTGQTRTLDTGTGVVRQMPFGPGVSAFSFPRSILEAVQLTVDSANGSPPDAALLKMISPLVGGASVPGKLAQA